MTFLYANRLKLCMRIDFNVGDSKLCFTFAEPFDDIYLFVKSSCALVRGNTNKSLRPKEERIDRSTEQASEFALAHLTPILHFYKIIVKTTRSENGTIPLKGLYMR